MNQRGFWQLELVSDAELQRELTRLLAVGARTEARIVAHLAEVDARKLHLAMGASSLFDYCLKRLGLSNNEAFHRITAAWLARQSLRKSRWLTVGQRLEAAARAGAWQRRESQERRLASAQVRPEPPTAP